MHPCDPVELAAATPAAAESTVVLIVVEKLATLAAATLAAVPLSKRRAVTLLGTAPAATTIAMHSGAATYL